MVRPGRPFDHATRLSKPRGIVVGRLAAAFLAVIVLTQPGWTQILPGVGESRIDPSILQQKPDRDLQNRGQEGQPLKPTTEVAPPEVDTSDATSESDDTAVEESPKFVLREILISGVTVFDAATLTEKFSPWLDREVGYKELLQIAGDITRLYKDNGYITSRAILPPQDIENGAVIIQVVEGKVGNVEIQGNRYVRDGYINRRVRLKPGEIFRLQTLQEDMLGLSSDTLLDKAHATLKTGQSAGTSDVVLDIDDHFPMHFMVGVDNMGRNGIGLWRESFTLSHENLLGFGDSLMLNATLASHTVATAGQYRFPLTPKGWALGGNYSFTHVNAGETPLPLLINDTVKQRTITGDSHRAAGFLDFPIYRSPVSRRWDISGNVSLNLIESMTYLDGYSLKDIQYRFKKMSQQTKVEKFPSLRTITSQVRVMEQDRTGRWLLNASMTNGFVALGGNDAYTKFNAEVTRIQALPHGLMAVLRAESQMTPDRLPFAEKMQLGGANSVRGYQEGWLLADGGYMLSAELRYPLVFLPKKIRNDWQGLVFAEVGQLFACGNNDVKNTEGRPGTLMGYGVGIRGRLTKYLNARLDFGFATVRDKSQPDLRAHFSLYSQLF